MVSLTQDRQKTPAGDKKITNLEERRNQRMDKEVEGKIKAYQQKTWKITAQHQLDG